MKHHAKQQVLDMDKVRALSDADLANRIARLTPVTDGLRTPALSEDFKWAVREVGLRHENDYFKALKLLKSEQRRRLRNATKIEPMPEWTPFVPASISPEQFYTPEAEVRFAKLGELSTPRRTMEEMRAIYLTQMDDEVYINSRYVCFVRRTPTSDGEGGIIEMVHISVKRHDQQPIDSWADKQRIKDDLLGPECEAIELFPARSRLVDTANQYHLWGVNSGTYRWPVGWNEGRVVLDEQLEGVGQQRAHKDAD